MTIVDYSIGAKAEFLNAYSVLQRLFGHHPTAGDSMVAQYYGAVGELAVVIVINIIVGVFLVFMISLFKRG
jgi:hypothetical protein